MLLAQVHRPRGALKSTEPPAWTRRVAESGRGGRRKSCKWQPLADLRPSPHSHSGLDVAPGRTAAGEGPATVPSGSSFLANFPFGHHF